MTTQYDFIRLEVEDRVATLTFNRPDLLNSLSHSMVAEIRDALQQVESSKDTRALLITGSGRAFSAGADLSAAKTSQNPQPPHDVGRVLEEIYNPLIETMAQLRVPIVVAVNGPAAGAGCSIALQGDFVIAARSAYFLLAFVKVGLVPDAGSTWVLPRLIGLPRARRMMMLAERISAEQAVEWGMIHSVVEDEALTGVARELALQLANGPTESYRLIRTGLRAAQEGSLTSTLAFEREAQRLAGLTADHAEGVRAFREKRQALFRGQ
jgi:2-(1,2-epoxy-1,2-dihydrophenyl)acetyl-CoA isomerase